MKRRNFLKSTAAAALIPIAAQASPKPAKKESDREFWLRTLDRIAAPVLDNMSRGELVKNLKVEESPRYDKRDKRVAYMEAFGRLIAGMAPACALAADLSAEGKLRAGWCEKIRKSLAHGVDPTSPDYLFWGTEKERQPLVDASYIAQALISSPATLWEPLDQKTKENVIREFTTIRKIVPFNNNWILFAAMIETFLLTSGEKIDESRIDPAVSTIEKWYVGDGFYSDGARFHFDHYNGYVIHAMMCQVLKINAEKGRLEKSRYDIALRRMQRYAHHLERMISPEGTYPVLGRSSTYRTALFWPLAKLAYEGGLPADVSPAQVRCALTAVFRRIYVDSTFRKDGGWLTIGLIGDRQSDIADTYSNTGSMYIATLAFWPLGLPATHEFWSAPFAEWTQLKAWKGEPFPMDRYVTY